VTEKGRKVDEELLKIKKFLETLQRPQELDHEALKRFLIEKSTFSYTRIGCGDAKMAAATELYCSGLIVLKLSSRHRTQEHLCDMRGAFHEEDFTATYHSCACYPLRKVPHRHDAAPGSQIPAVIN